MSDVLVSCRHCVALAYYLLEDIAMAKRYGQLVTEDIQAYFFGDWRNTCQTDEGTLDSNCWRRESNWIYQFKYALCWGASLGLWEPLARIAQYPTTDCPIDMDCHLNDKDLCLAIAGYLSGQPPKKWHQYLEQAESGRKKKARLAASVMRAVSEKSSTSFNLALHLSR